MASSCLIPVQQKLYDVFDTRGLRQPIGAYDALQSTYNKTANPVQVALVDKGGPGKVASYRLQYVAPECSAVINCGDTGSGICEAGGSKPVTTVVKTISNCFSLKNIELTLDQFRDLCLYGPDDFITGQLLGRLDTGMQEVNRRIDATLGANVGCFKAGVTDPKDIALINPTNNAPIFGATRQITQAFRQVGAEVDPILIGGDALDMYNYAQQFSGPAQSGVNPGREPKFPIYYDNQLSTVLPVAGRETLLALMPGVAQFVQYLSNVGMFATDMKPGINLLDMFNTSEVYDFGVLQDPKTGYIWDVSVQWIQCETKWIINLKTQFDVWVMPLTQCYADCFTGILKYGVCNYTPIGCAA